MRFWFMLAAALILAGCSSHRAPPPNPRLADSITVVANLNEQLRSWRGAPYRYGGMTPRGVDCSGFVVRTFRDKFALQLPRETREQADRLRGERPARWHLRYRQPVYSRLHQPGRHPFLAG